MNTVGLPSTFFTAPPQWHWLIILYFFIGGLAGGCYFLAVLIDFFGRAVDRPLARIGYYVAFPAVVVSGLLLMFDLGRPARFWHMLIQSNAGRPMFKSYSPMSLGSWALLVFGAFAFLSFVAALEEDDRLRWRWLGVLRPPHIVGAVVAVLGGLLAFFVAGYTGVLLSVTNRPIWADTSLLGLVFLISAVSTSAALMVLLARGRWSWRSGIVALERFDSMALVFELVALIGLIVSLGSVARVWLDAWGALLVVGVVLAGIVLPLLLKSRPRWLGERWSEPTAAALVLIGGFLLRVIVILSSESAGVIG